MISLFVNGEKKAYADGTLYLTIAQEYQHNYEEDILLALVDGKLQELFKKSSAGEHISFILASDAIGNQTYRRSVELMLMKALYDIIGHDVLAGVIVDYSLSKGWYCRLKGGYPVTQELLDKVERRMHELVAQKLPIEKESINTEVALKRFHEHRMYDKENLFRYRRVSKVNLYRINEFEDYYYGSMVPNTGYLKYFKLYLYDEGFVIQMPVKESPKTLPAFEPQHKVFQVMKESAHWSETLNVSTVGALNDHITRGGFSELILIQEALMEKKVADIAEQIAKHPHKKVILIAGPSSSGKTTFSHRLSIQLRANGLKPHPIPVDDYFIDRDKSPVDEYGNYNYEDLECIDVAQFDQDIAALLRGERVELPTYNFKIGKREYKDKVLQLGEDDILVIEGIHCLNDALTPDISSDNKFKIYISALTQLNIDEHNRIPTTDGRLIRRMVRDARTRGASAQDTIAMWHSVRRGEEKNIFPYQESADVVFNSALIYELAVLKQYAEPLLFSIDRNQPEYLEAKRLLKFFDYFLGVSSEDIPNTSVLREFIGGGCFHV